MAVATETLAIALAGEEHSFPIFSFLDRRMRKPQRKQWVLVRAVERLLFGVTEGVRSTGRFALHLSNCSMAESVLVCDKAAVEEDETITQEEFEAGTSSQGSSLHAYCGLRSPSRLTRCPRALGSHCRNEDARGPRVARAHPQGQRRPHHPMLLSPVRVWAQ